MTRLEKTALGLVLLCAVVVRAWNLDRDPLWVDEAESCINALTILDHGCPVNHYLGMPLFENTLIKLWPESEEYEFRDLSYSSKGVAIYHGWLPLYSIAAAFWLAGIEPDQPKEQVEFRYSVSDMAFRTKVARLPSVIFSIVFLLALFRAGYLIFDRAAGWAALLLASFSPLYVWYAWQARYYSPTVALNILCLLCAWLMLQRGRWRDFLLGALSFVLLFHTHMIFWFAGGLVCLALTPLLLRHPQGLKKVVVFGLLIVAGTVPWLILTGFLEEASRMPKAWSLLQFPEAFIEPLSRRNAVPIAIGGVWLGASFLLRRHLPKRFTEPLLPWMSALLFLAFWLMVNFLAFTFMMPAASYFYLRLVLGLVAPGVLLTAALFSALGQLSSRRRPIVVCIALVIAYLAGWERAYALRLSTRDLARSDVVEGIDFLRQIELRPGTRIYATPSANLILTFYSGVPIQTIAPIRKSFLENYPGDIVIIEAFRRYNAPPIPPEEVAELARNIGLELSEEEARETSRTLRRLMTAAYAAERGAVAVTPPPPRHDRLFEYLTPIQRQRQEQFLKNYFRDPTSYLLLQGFPFPDLSVWWELFFYRFSEPEKRTGPNVNYACRIKGATATVLRSNWVIFESPGSRSKTTEDKRGDQEKKDFAVSFRSPNTGE
ncbi:MAG TPA: glycosyltransferase family 39 protein [Acidobacteriota bacterium]|nr:glycosyltransferase family 39 protein [Acidobacteriota bacterium]